MKLLKHKLALLLLLVLVSTGAMAATSSALPTPTNTFAAADPCPGQDTLTVDNNLAPDQHTCCPKGSQKAGKDKSNATNCLFAKYVNPLIVTLSTIFGVAVVAGIIWGGIQYSSAGGDVAKVQKAKDHIRNSIFALVVFIFLFALLNWLIPGGIT